MSAGDTPSAAEGPTPLAVRESDAVTPGRATRRARRPRVSSFGMLVIAFVLLLGAAVAVAFGQLAANGRAPWVSVALSACAVAATVAALVMRRRP